MIESTQRRRLGRLRRRRDADRLVAWSDDLSPPDRELVRGVFERGLTVAALGRAAGVDPRCLQNRLRRLIRRMRSREFQLVRREASRWPRPRRRIARAIFLKGKTQRETAEALDVSLHEVRRTVEHIRLIVAEDRAARR